MTTLYVNLPTTQRVQAFVATLIHLDGDFELVEGIYIIDARSLMGIFSLNLSVPIQLNVYNSNVENLKALQPFVSTEKEIKL